MNILKSILLLLLIISCQSSKEEKKVSAQKDKSIIKIETDSVLVPKFEIEIKLSETAEKKLLAEKETIIVRALFFGIPKDSLQNEEYQELGRSTIGLKQIELNRERVAKFYNCKISKETLKSLADKNFEVNINVYTGGKSSDFNLINCDFLQEGIDSIKNKRTILKGKLLTEE